MFEIPDDVATWIKDFMRVVNSTDPDTGWDKLIDAAEGQLDSLKGVIDACKVKMLEPGPIDDMEYGVLSGALVSTTMAEVAHVFFKLMQALSDHGQLIKVDDEMSTFFELFVEDKSEDKDATQN